MPTPQSQQVLLELSRGKPRFADSLPALMVCALLVGVLAGIAGWKGQGLIGKWVGPGLMGLLAAGLAGFALPLVLYGLTFLFGSWASVPRTRANFVAIVLWFLFFFPTWWASGWYGVYYRLLRFLPLFAVLGLIALWLEAARNRHAPMFQSRMSSGASHNPS